MSTELRIQTRVLPGHRIEVTAPELIDCASVDVTILLGQETETPTPLDLLRMPLEERDKVLARQADALLEYYESTAHERVEWQGGDILE